jgi:histone-lysine N-methyltransferase SUV420H
VLKLGAKVIAIRHIPKNNVLFELCGQLYSVSDQFLIPGVNDFSTVTSCINDNDLMFLGPVSFINHDCSPNVQWHSRSRSLSCVKTIKNILTNDEILVFYGPHFFGINNIECKCKTCETSCRGFFSVKECKHLYLPHDV